MYKRKVRIVKPNFPLTGVCEHCNKNFISRNEELEQAHWEVVVQFSAHTCELTGGRQNAPWIVRRDPEDK
jgi:hypothetical protein